MYVISVTNTTLCYTLGKGLFWSVPHNFHRTVQCQFRTIRCILCLVWDEIVKLKKQLNIKNGWSWHWTLQARVIGKYVNHWDTAATGNQKVIFCVQVFAYHTNHLYIIISSVRYDNKLYGQQIYIAARVQYTIVLYTNIENVWYNYTLYRMPIYPLPNFDAISKQNTVLDVCKLFVWYANFIPNQGHTILQIWVG